MHSQLSIALKFEIKIICNTYKKLSSTKICFKKMIIKEIILRLKITFLNENYSYEHINIQIYIRLNLKDKIKFNKKSR